MEAARGWSGGEGARLAELDAHDDASLLDHPALQEVVDFAASLCGAPIAFISLVGADEQRFIARAGITLDGSAREISFCTHAMAGTDIMVVPDALADPRFAGNPLVTGAPHVRFYAGAPLVSRAGAPLGSLCVVDTNPRDGLTPLQLQGLRVLAAGVIARLRDLRTTADLSAATDDARRAMADSEQRFRTLADTMPQMVWSTLPDGFHDYYNARWYEFTGAPPGTTDGEGWNDMFHPDDQARAWEIWRHSLAIGDPYQIEYRLRHFDGTYRWVLGRALPIRDAGGAITRWFGTCTDIHEQKLAFEEREVISQELSHRIKNIFAVISGLISFAARGRPEFAMVANDLRDRITALGRAHDFVRPHSSTSRPAGQQDSLHALLTTLFLPYQEMGDPRLRVAGDDLAIDDRSATPLALLFHELATNASKYGALSVARGRVDVTLVRSAEAVTIRWAESGGPTITRSGEAKGFGSQLIEMSAVRQLGGTVARDWAPAGLIVTIVVPLSSFNRR